MKYLIIGAGGTGGCIGGYLARAGYDVDLVARGNHAEMINSNGLTLKGTKFGDFTVDIKASDADGYDQKADVVFVCVKSFSIDEILPLLKKVMKEDAIVVPTLNGIGIGDRIKEAIPEADILNGCLYINAYIEAPGTIRQAGKMFRLVCAASTEKSSAERIGELAEGWKNAGIDVKESSRIERDQFRKFMFVSPLSATQIYYDKTTECVQKEGDEREFFKGLIRELGLIAQARGYEYPVDMVEDGIRRVEAMAGSVKMSLYLDVEQGKQAETYEQIITPIRLGAAYGFPMERYRKVADKLGLAVSPLA